MGGGRRTDGESKRVRGMGEVGERKAGRQFVHNSHFAVVLLFVFFCARPVRVLFSHLSSVGKQSDKKRTGSMLQACGIELNQANFSIVRSFCTLACEYEILYIIHACCTKYRNQQCLRLDICADKHCLV